MFFFPPSMVPNGKTAIISFISSALLLPFHSLWIKWQPLLCLPLLFFFPLFSIKCLKINCGWKDLISVINQYCVYKYKVEIWSLYPASEIAVGTLYCHGHHTGLGWHHTLQQGLCLCNSPSQWVSGSMFTTLWHYQNTQKMNYTLLFLPFKMFFGKTLELDLLVTGFSISSWPPW